MISGIYKIVNKVNGLSYVGSAVSYHRRVNVHCNDLRKNRHHSQKLQRAWNKYGEDAFEYIFLEHVDDRKSLISREQFWIRFLDSYCNGYNSCPNAGSALSRVHTKETKQKMSISATGKKHTKETKEKISTIQIGRKVSENVKKRASETHRGRKHSPEHIEKVAAAHRGLKHSKESRIKMSMSKKGKKLSKEHINKISLSNTGKKRSPEIKEKFRQAWVIRKEKKNSAFSS